MLQLIPNNQNLPDDIYLIKLLKGRNKKQYYAPSILVHDSEILFGDKELEEVLDYRQVYGSKFLLVDIIVKNNSYLPVSDRKVSLYYVEQENVQNMDTWKRVKTVSGNEKVEIERVLPCQEGWTRESFSLVFEREKPYFLIAALDEEENETTLSENAVDLNQLNESYYWCILDSRNITKDTGSI